MPAHEIRTFRRPDREQVTQLVNAHAAAVLPGAAASVNAVLGQFESEPDETVVDPWVAERRALVAIQQDAVAAAALIHRCRDDEAVGSGYRNAAVLRWLLFWPMAPAGNPYRSDGHGAADALMAACLDQFRHWRVDRILADGRLPLPGVYGVPEQWPHIARLYRDHGFGGTRTEILHLLDLTTFTAAPDLQSPQSPTSPESLPPLRVRRLVGINGVRFSADHDGTELGYLETEVLDAPQRHAARGGLADIGNLYVAEAYRRRGVASRLLADAAAYLRLGGVDRLLHYATPEQTDELGFVRRHGFVEITRILRGWDRPTTATAPGGARPTARPTPRAVPGVR